MPSERCQTPEADVSCTFVSAEGDESGRFPAWLPAVMLPVVAMAALGASSGSMPDFAAAMVIILTDGIMALLVLTAAGGFGWAVLRSFRPEQSPTLLCLATAAVLGLWMLSTAVLVVGSLIPGALTMYLWWSVVGGGVVLAAVMSRRRFTAHRQPSVGCSPASTEATKPHGMFTVGSLLWILPATAAGLWLAGAVMPPGWLGNLTMDSYDVLEYHLQLPREYYHAGQIATLNHNVYSHYPLGMEMLFLLGMCLRGGAYEGVHLAKLMPGLFGVIMVTGVLGGTGFQPVQSERFRARAAAVLLATSPWVIYLSGLAMVEPAQFCCLALAMLWLRQWMGKPSVRTAVIIGAMLGAACAVKYLSVGLVAGPVLAVMLIASVARRRIAHVALAGGAAVLLFSPWFLRNTADTGNPVFPLATGLFGQGHFSDESAARWRDGHASGYHLPVPVPPDYRPPERQPSRSERFFAFLSGRIPYDTQPAIGAGVLALAVATVLAMFLRLRASKPWEWAVLGVLVIQMVVWAFFTRDMPARFIAPAIVPLSLLAAGGLGRLWGEGRLRKTITVLLLVAAGVWNLVPAWNYLNNPAQHRRLGVLDIPGPVMLIGESRAFYFPPHSVYATVFDEHPLVGIVGRSGSPDEATVEIRRMGVTHVFVSWVEIDRLSHSYGWPAEMSAERLRRLFASWKVVDDLSTDRPVFTLYSTER